jgi:hypothetical protein
MPEAEISESISNISIDDAERKLEQSPSGLITVPLASGAYVIDGSVKRGKKTVTL